MVQKLDGSHDDFTMVGSLIENILNDAFKTIKDRSEITNTLLENEHFKFDEVESIELNEEILGTGQVLEEKNVVDVSSCWTNMCYQSLPNLSVVCAKDSSLSNSSKQGEGDQHPKMREAPAFYKLNVETDIDSFDQCQKKSSSSSLNTDTSHNEIIQCLQNEIYNLSFDSIQLSDSETDDGEGVHSKSPTNESIPISFRDSKESGNNNDQKKLADDQNQNEQRDFSDGQTTLPQSQKFCQYNNVQYFPYNILPENYCQLVNESYEKYQAVDDEEGDKLLSDSSEELVIIDGEENDIPCQDYIGPRSFECPSMCSVKPSSTVLLPQSPRPSTSTDIHFPVEAKYANVESASDRPNWEENNEVQVNVIEPTGELEEHDDIEESEDNFRTHEYWSNVGLIKETVMDRRYLGPVDQIPGMEQGVRREEEQCFRNGSDELLWITMPQNDEESISQATRPQSALESTRFSYLTVRAKEETPKKKKKLIARLTSSFSNLFRSKKKTIKNPTPK